MQSGGQSSSPTPDPRGPRRGRGFLTLILYIGLVTVDERWIKDGVFDKNLPAHGSFDL